MTVQAAQSAQEVSHHTASPLDRAIGRFLLAYRQAIQATTAASSPGTVPVNETEPCGAMNAGSAIAASTAGPT